MSYGRGRAFQALGLGLANIGQLVRENRERDAAIADRDAERAARAAEREADKATREREMDLRLRTTPGVSERPRERREILPEPGLDIPDFSKMLEPPAQPSALQGAAADFAPAKLDAPKGLAEPVAYDAPGAVPEGQIELTDNLMYDPRHEEARALRMSRFAAPEPPVRGSPEYMAMLEGEERIKAKFREPRAGDDPRTRKAEEANGAAQMWASEGRTAQEIAQGIKQFYPQVPAGQRMGMAARAVRDLETANLRNQSTQSLIDNRTQGDPLTQLVARMQGEQGDAGADAGGSGFNLGNMPGGRQPASAAPAAGATGEVQTITQDQADYLMNVQGWSQEQVNAKYRVAK